MPGVAARGILGMKLTVSAVAAYCVNNAANVKPEINRARCELMTVLELVFITGWFLYAYCFEFSKREIFQVIYAIKRESFTSSSYIILEAIAFEAPSQWLKSPRMEKKFHKPEIQTIVNL
jgi:hypothetical protein